MSYGYPRKPMPPPVPPGGMREMPPQNYGQNYGGYSGGGQGGGGSSAGERILGVQKVANPDQRNDYIFSNICAVSPQDFPRDPQGRDHYILIQNADPRVNPGQYVVVARTTEGFPMGGLSLSEPQRAWCGVSMKDQLRASVYDPFNSGYPAYIGSIDIMTSFASQKEDKRTKEPFEETTLEIEARRLLNNHVLAPKQRLLMEVRGIPILLVVQGITLVDLGAENMGQKMIGDPNYRGIVTQKSSFRFMKDGKDGIEINSAREEASTQSIFQAGFSFEDLGIGGLGDEFQIIIRRAFNSRMISPDQAKKLGIKHVKGMLLFGPPGTGKTLIARQIGKMLNTKEPKVINGPQILNKYVGQSEENVRKMFEDAQKEYDEKGDRSGLHLIIFDELDAVCKQRGSGAGGGTGVGDSVVNQLLSILDGVKPLNNILLIGMTNRKDMIDEALLRPGRLEVHLEIALPDEPGRLEILQIHTKTMAGNGALEADVNLEVIAKQTKNYSGAELSGVVNSATSYALARHVEIGLQPKLKKDSGRIKLRQDDFMRAVREVKPAYGVAEDEIGAVIEFGIVKYAPRIGQIMDAVRASANAVEIDETKRRMSVLLWGPPGAGKTALAAQIALDSGFPFVQMLGPEHLVNHVSELSKMSHINSVFDKANRSPLSIVILDDLTRLVEWNKIGSMYSNKILQTIATRIRALPPQGRRVLVIATTSDFQVLQDFGLTDMFSKKVRVDPVRTVDEMGEILEKIQAFEPGPVRKIVQALKSGADDGGQGRLDLGIKHLLELYSEARATARKRRIERGARRADEREMDGMVLSEQEAAQDESQLNAEEIKDRANRFVELMAGVMQ